MASILAVGGCAAAGVIHLRLTIPSQSATSCRVQRRCVACCAPQHGSSGLECKRRDLLQIAAATSSLSLLAFPATLRAANSKSDRSISIHELREIVQKDFVQNQYYVTGRLSPAAYTENCQFKDPTTNVKGVQPYTSAVAKLFDASKSKAELISLKIADPNTLVLRWRLAATLNFPGGPAIKPYTGTTKYVTNESGLICQHLEQWDISAFDAFVSVLFPKFGAQPAPPLSELTAELH